MPTASPSEGLVQLRLDRVAPGSGGQVRQQFDAGRLAALASSVKRSGVREPLIVAPDASAPGHYRIVFGGGLRTATTGPPACSIDPPT